MATQRLNGNSLAGRFKEVAPLRTLVIAEESVWALMGFEM
jgi:hypothetical protein